MFNPWIGKFPWTREWQPTLVLLPGESYGQRRLVGYSPWGCKELDMTEHVTLPLSLAEVPERIAGKVRRGTVMCGAGKWKHIATKGWDFRQDGNWRSIFSVWMKNADESWGKQVA